MTVIMLTATTVLHNIKKKRPMVDFTKQLQRIVAAKGLACSYTGFHKDVKPFVSMLCIAMYMDFTWGKFEPLATLQRGKRWL